MLISFHNWSLIYDIFDKIGAIIIKKKINREIPKFQNSQFVYNQMAKCHRNSINLKLINSMFAPIKLEHDFLKRCCAHFVYFWLNATLKINIIYIYIYWDSKCFRFLFKQVQHWFTLVNSKRKILKLKQNADIYSTLIF